MRRFSLQTAAALFAFVATAAAPMESSRSVQGSDETPARNFAVRCGTLHTGDGRVLEDCWLIVRDGDVAEIREGGEAPADLPVVDASNRVVMPGLVAADTDLSGARDDQYSVTPDLVALDDFDLIREYPAALRGGVTTVYLSPGRSRFVSGQGSVVKLAGNDLVERVLSERNCLRITLGPKANTAPPIFEPVVAPTSDNPLEPARRQYPSSRLSQLPELRRVFLEALQPGGDVLLGTGSPEKQYDPTPLRDVTAGSLGLRFDAYEAQDIRRALMFAEEIGATDRVVFENPIDLGPVLRSVVDKNAGVVLRVPVLLGASNSGGENRLDDTKRITPETAGMAESAGLRVALAPARDQYLQDMLLVAGVAVRHGMSVDGALAGITSTAAELLGVDDRVGSLAVGKDADFLILSGEPLAVGTLVEQTWIDGRREFVRQDESDVLAIRAGTIWTAEGPAIQDGTIIIRDGRIRGVGTGLTAPYGARIIDLTDSGSFAVPGFIDANSRLGLSGDGTSVPGGAPNQKIDEVVRHDDPVFQAPLRAGVTTVLSSGRDGGVVSGRIAALKTGAANNDDAVVAPIVGLRMVFDSITDGSIKPIADQIGAGKKYLAAWQKYEKALAEWKAGDKPAPEPEPEPEEEKKPEEGAKPDPVSGTWECELKLPVEIPFEITATIVITLEGETVTGTVTLAAGPREPQTVDFTGTFKDGKLMGEVQTPFGSGNLEATIKDDKIEGKLTQEGGGPELTISGTRTSKSTAAPKPRRVRRKKPTEDGRPKPPDTNEALEPIKAMLEGKATAVIRTNRAPAIKQVLELFRKEKIRFVLQDAGDALDTPEILGDEAPAMMLGPNLVGREKGKVVNNAARAADLDAQLALVTGDTAGSRYLPLHVAHAIRYGLDPQTALRAITIDPAKMFGIDDRVGSIRRGKDADLVVFDGSPFEMTSRVLLVVCDGRVVYDATEANR